MKRRIRGFLLSGNIITIVTAHYYGFGYFFWAYLYALFGGGMNPPLPPWEIERLQNFNMGLGFLFFSVLPFAIVGIVFACVRKRKFRYWPSIVSTIYAIIAFILEFIGIFTPIIPHTSTPDIKIPVMILLSYAIFALIFGMIKAHKEQITAINAVTPQPR